MKAHKCKTWFCLAVQIHYLDLSALFFFDGDVVPVSFSLEIFIFCSQGLLGISHHDRQEDFVSKMILLHDYSAVASRISAQLTAFHIAHPVKCQVEERLVAVDELLEADEVFCTGTAVVVSPVGSITYKGKR